ncbi:MAG: class I SAM-dependent methyltransferase [Pseudomonadota bacterium]|nr:class I SAM-dependent methyltransferase [Pseudomonadota bacterium]
MTIGKNRDEIAEAYDSPPWWYDVRGFFILTFAYNSTIGTQLRFFGPNFGPEHIEIACGTGTLLEMTMNWRRRHKLPKVKVIGIDYAPSMLAGARKRFANDPQVTVQHADAAQLPFADNSFDTANIANSIHCFPTIDGALTDILRVLKPGGTLAANVLLYPSGFKPLRWAAQKINDWGIRKGILYSPFKQEDIRRKILAAGYEISSDFKAGNTWNVVARKPLTSMQ